MAAILLIAGLFVAAAGLTLSGIYILAGLAATLIAAGLLLFAAALCLRKGLTANG